MVEKKKINTEQKEKKTYTYRKGKKVYLKKEPDQFVVRAKREENNKEEDNKVKNIK